MASIGEFFKFLGSNSDFHTLCQDADKSVDQIIEDVFQNDGLISSLRTIVQDDSIIRSKMSVVIGQKRKQTHPKNKKEDEEEEVTKKNDDIVVFAYNPLNVSNVMYLDKNFYTEKVDHRIRLVTRDYEMYY
jgi:hypothetical protein